MVEPPTLDKSYTGFNKRVIEMLPAVVTRVLDVGCGTGVMGRAIKSANAARCEVIGLTHSQAEAEACRQNIDRVVVCDLNAFSGSELGQFDCIICSHVLEHLYDPKALLRQLRGHLVEGGALIVALPNVLHWKQRLIFLMGNFRYTDYGILDRTHFKFFDRQTARELVQDSGFDVTLFEADGWFPLPLLRGAIGPKPNGLDRFAVRVAPGLLGWQFLLKAQLRQGR